MCGSDSVNYWETLEKWICDGCSFVVNATESDGIPQSIPNQPADNRGDNSTGRCEVRDWTESISVRDKSEANLIEVLSMIETTTDELSLSDDITIRSGEIIVEAWKRNFMHGRNKPDTVGAAVYLASRESNNSIPPALIAEEIVTDKQSLKAIYKNLKDELEINIDPPRPGEYVPSLCRELGLSSSVERDAQALLDAHDQGGNPIGIAAASVYEAAKSETEITLRRTAQAGALTKETIWKHATSLRSE